MEVKELEWLDMIVALLYWCGIAWVVNQGGVCRLHRTFESSEVTAIETRRNKRSKPELAPALYAHVSQGLFSSNRG